MRAYGYITLEWQIGKSENDHYILKRLKGTENELGKISITDDYTNGERDLIKIWVKKAAEKSA